MRICGRTSGPLTAAATMLMCLAATGPAFGQAGEGVIDLTPMLELMPPGATGSLPPEVLPEDDVADPPATADVEAGDDASDDAASDEAAAAEVDLTDDGVMAYLPVQIRSTPDETATIATDTARRLRFRSASGAGITRITGERGIDTLHIFIANPGEAEAITLSLRSSVALLPDRSFLILTLNDTEIGRIDPTAFADFTTVTLPPDGLVEGENRLVVEARQHHRIFCGAEATFQLWSEIDLAASGVDLRPSSGLLSEAHFRQDLMSAALSTGRVTLLEPEPMPDALFDDLQRRLPALAGGLPVVLAAQNPFDPLDGIGTDARLAFLPSAGDRIALRQGADGAIVLTFGPDVLPDAFDRYLPAPLAPADHPAAPPDLTVPLSQLGQTDIDMFNRYERVDIPFVLPEDWLLSSAQSARLDLLYRYADNLPRNGLLLVKVNEATIRLLPLAGEPGIVLPLLPIRFPARLMEPGVNLLTFETIVPGDPPDRPCPPIEGPLVEIFSESALTIPASPSMAYPSVATVLRRLGPQDISSSGSDASLADAMSRELVPLAGTPDDGIAQVLLLGLDTLDVGRAEAMGLTLLQIEEALLPGPAVQQAPPPSDHGLFARGMEFYETIRVNLLEMAWPGDPPIERWIVGRTGRALLVVPDAAAPFEVWMVAAPGVDPDWLAQQLSRARFEVTGPKAQGALLREDGTWERWRPRLQPPIVLGQLGPRDLRTAAGNFASWSPALFVALMAVFLSISVLAGLLFVNRTRSGRKR
ncbi:MAG: cellulose biosynthesis cyclic di-GMP-binding regulatory protein BcsB [Rubellimicrobium sp.]|nr:cellulose biosynthesis cyclic di-GMP-binding regulatory protein BcsB [Rubellimicrobium sp.]